MFDLPSLEGIERCRVEEAAVLGESEIVPARGPEDQEEPGETASCG